MKNTNNQNHGLAIKAPKVTSKLTKALALGVIASGLSVNVSEAVLRVTFDMRAVQNGLTGVSSSGLNGVENLPTGQMAEIAPGASSIVLQLVATINSDAIVQDAFLRADGAFITSGTVGLTGSMRSDASTGNGGINNPVPFRGLAAKSGLATELTVPGDGISDIGATTTTSAFTNFFTAQSTDLTNGALGQTFVIGETVLTLDGSAGGTTTVNFVPRLFTGAGAAGARTSFIFKVDGTQFSYRGDGALASQNGGAGDATTFAFKPLTLTVVPEPTAFGMVLLGAMGLVGFRRMGLRRS